MSKKKKKLYPKNPNYCMILPDAKDADEENIVSSNQS